MDESYDTYDTYDGGYEAADSSYDTASYDTASYDSEPAGCCDCGPTEPAELPPTPADAGAAVGTATYGDPYGYDTASYDTGTYDGTQSPVAAPQPGDPDPYPAPPAPPLPTGCDDGTWTLPSAGTGFDVAQVPPAGTGFEVAQVPPAATWPETTPVFSPIATPFGNPLPNAGLPNAGLPEATPVPSVVDPIAAEIQEDTAFWFRQGTTYSCGPASVSQVIEDFTGIDLNNEWDVFNYADGQGWIEHGKGMTIANLEKTIDAFGVDSTVTSGSLADADQLAESGHGVVLFVDGAKYWPDYAGGSAPHFARLLDVDWAKGTALMSDSWTGGPLEVSIDALSNAWNLGGPDGGSKMLVTNGTDPDGVGVGAGAPVRF
ncbi:MAG: hypothetical protein ACYC2O_11845 [Microthrixaceae bacterium]